MRTNVTHRCFAAPRQSKADVPALLLGRCPRSALAAVLAAFAASIDSINAQLIVNGGFETPDTRTYMYINAGQTTLAPWCSGAI